MRFRGLRSLLILVCLLAAHETPAAPAQSVTQLPDTGPAVLQSIPNPEPPAGEWKRAQVVVAHTDTPPKIDGAIDDACWLNATHVAGFYRSGGTSPVVDQTETWFCADDRRLYFAFHCLDSHPEQIAASETTRDSDGIFQDDQINIDIDSQSSRRNLSSFFVTPRGTQKQFLEGGTADNIVWAGDWQAATKRTPDGWDCEISIPFALLRYPRGTHSFGIGLFRKQVRESSATSWPYLPREGWVNGYSQEAQYLNDFAGFTPPDLKPRPIFLPYSLTTLGQGTANRVGVDIKYPLSTTITGLASLLPDFQNIEQDVTDVNFSYTEKFQSDRRPFFAEGSGYFPGNDVFYSRRIGAFDGGLKIAGKQDGTTIGVLGTSNWQGDHQDAAVVRLNRDLGVYSRAEFDYASDQAHGAPNNAVARMAGVYGFNRNGTIYSLEANHTPSWSGGKGQDSSDYVRLNMRPQPGHVGFTLSANDIGPSFTSRLGYVPETDLRGASLNIRQTNHFDTGWIDDYGVEFNANRFDHHTGGFFRDNAGPNFWVDTKAGQSLSGSYTQGRRDQNRDHVTSLSLGWNNKTLYAGGSVSMEAGSLAGQHYRYTSISQGTALSSRLFVKGSMGRLDLGGDHNTQTVVTGSYHLSDTRTIGGRLVSEGSHTNVYFSFGQHVRTGNDVFVLFGDPNSATTVGRISLKIVRPF